MNAILNLMRWDIILLNRNRLFVIAAIVTLMYVGLFYLFSPLGDLTILLVILIYNDPVVTGYLFAGVLWLFDRNQHTLQALSVLPLPLKSYLLAKTLVLSLLATLLSFIMTIATKGLTFNGFHLAVSVFGSAFLFSCFGFAIGALTRSFNQFLLYSIPFFVVAALPFLPMFGVGQPLYFVLLPSTGGIELLQAAFTDQPIGYVLLLYGHLLLWMWLSWLLALRITQHQLT
ncbi:hypothetical protein GCM10023189_19280 [Nibrella saemangeumensis]|uniref:Fluoroquinolone transport system permease protein n=1 Tax=Nibrella saemangeumensis TaxID=1084526 RepID=A0ABP8MPJ6_9BACT